MRPRSAGSIYDGTWSGGAPPEELVDFETMWEMDWSWAELMDTPWYVRKFT